MHLLPFSRIKIMNRCHSFKKSWLAIALLTWTAGTLVTRAEPPTAKSPAKPAKTTRTLGIVLYPMFELLDVYGPAEVFGNVNQGLKIVMVGQKAGPVTSAQGPQVLADCGFDDCPPLDLVLVPGGMGTLAEVKNPAMLEWLRARAKDAELVMSVCSGSAILAEAGLLDGRKATSNKRYFQVAVDHGPKVNWIEQARWVDDGDRVTSSGVSAGIDMSLAVVARLYGAKTAETIADLTEYEWHKDANHDPFYRPKR
jgi:transcriptional regulator GlxA family with amidase domain